MRKWLLGNMSPARAERYGRIAHEVNRSVTGYMLGNILTSIIAGMVVFVTLLVTGVPYPLLWALWVALVDFLPMIGGALAGIPTVLFAATHSLTAGIITLVVFLVYTQVENHILNPVVMSKTVRVNPLLVLLSILIGASIGDWIGGTFGAFVAALLAIPAAGALQVITREVWQEHGHPAAGIAGRGAAGRARRTHRAPGAGQTGGPGGTGQPLRVTLRRVAGSAPRSPGRPGRAAAGRRPGGTRRPRRTGGPARWLPAPTA